MNNNDVTARLRRECVARAFGRVLKERRKSKGISQEELAFRTEFDRTYPSLLERGLRTPTLGMILAFARALDTALELLITETLIRLQRSVDNVR
jgi:transcriptional regulator with XRE-family HTH domain